MSIIYLLVLSTLFQNISFEMTSTSHPKRESKDLQSREERLLLSLDLELQLKVGSVNCLRVIPYNSFKIRVH